MSSVLAVATQAINSTQTPAPLIGSKNENYAGLQVLGAILTVGIITVLAFLRRYLAAKAASLSLGQRVGFAIRIWPGTTVHDNVQVPRGLLVGTDNRASTSKTAAALWTVVLIYFIISMALIFGGQPDQYNSLIQSISPLYLVLLGGPFAAAVLAKSIVSGAVDAGQLQKGQGNPSVADVFSDDDGNTDLIDSQYIVFNVVVAVIVIVQFASHPGYGAPSIPDFLAALTGTSAAAYVANKAVTTGNPPSITQVNPGQVRPEGQAALYGQNFRLQGDTPADVSVTVAGQPAQLVDPPPTPTEVTFRVAPNALTGPVVVRTPSGLSTPAAGTSGANGSPLLTVVPDSIQVTSIDSLSTGAPGTLTLHGGGFFNAADVDWQGNAANGSKPETTGRLTPLSPAADKQAQAIDCMPSDNVVQSDIQLTLSVPAGVQPGSYRLTLVRRALSCDPPVVVQVT